MTTNQSMSDLDILTDALDLSELPVEEQEEILVDINDLVLQATITKIIEVMDEKTRDEFSMLIDSGPSDEAVADFIEAHVPNSDELVQETIQDFADDILAVTKE